MYFVLDIKVDEWDCRTEKEARDKETGAFCGGRSEDNGTCMIRDGEDDVAVVCTLVRRKGGRSTNEIMRMSCIMPWSLEVM